MFYRGKVRIGRKTKELVKSLKAGEIAVIAHQDIDEIAALSLCEKKVSLIINCARSITGRYPNPGPKIILSRGIALLDECPEFIPELLQDGDFISVSGNTIYYQGQIIGQGNWLTLAKAEEKMQSASRQLDRELSRFINNTLEYAAKEKELILGGFKLPDLRTELKAREALIVIRGKNYQEDLRIILPYIKAKKPVLIGVDGGADLLLKAGCTPHLIIGDMDSISDKALLCGAELVVHAYADGRAPGLRRIEKLNLQAKTFSAPGTSEDIALLLAYEKGASLLVTLGSHTSMLDFLEKGRNGMGSTFLVRLKVGSALVDAKGVSRLYPPEKKLKDFIAVLGAGMLPLAVILNTGALTGQIVRLIELKLRILFGW